MNKKTAVSLTKAIEKSNARIAKERDKLRELISDAESLYDACDRAVDSLESAADALSEYV
jgi:hypothetical protein